MGIHTFLTEAPRVSLRLQPNSVVPRFGGEHVKVGRACEREATAKTVLALVRFDPWEQSCWERCHGFYFPPHPELCLSHRSFHVKAWSPFPRYSFSSAKFFPFFLSSFLPSLSPLVLHLLYSPYLCSLFVIVSVHCDHVKDIQSH